MSFHKELLKLPSLRNNMSHQSLPNITTQSTTPIVSARYNSQTNLNRRQSKLTRIQDPQMLSNFKLSMRRKLLQLVQKKQDEERLMDNSRIASDRTSMSQERAQNTSSPSRQVTKKIRKKASIQDDLESPVLARKKLKKTAVIVENVKK